jgi:hypothetical protein
MRFQSTMLLILLKFHWPDKTFVTQPRITVTADSNPTRRRLQRDFARPSFGLSPNQAKRGSAHSLDE